MRVVTKWYSSVVWLAFEERRGIKKYMNLLKTDEKIITITLWCMLSEDFPSVIICL
jgi:hypothetical protein